MDDAERVAKQNLSVDGDEWQSEVGHKEIIDNEPDDEIPFRLVGAATSRTAFRFTPTVNLVEVFQERVLCDDELPQIPYRAVQARQDGP